MIYCECAVGKYEMEVAQFACFEAMIESLTNDYPQSYCWDIYEDDDLIGYFENHQFVEC